MSTRSHGDWGRGDTGRARLSFVHRGCTTAPLSVCLCNLFALSVRTAQACELGRRRGVLLILSGTSERLHACALMRLGMQVGECHPSYSQTGL